MSQYLDNLKATRTTIITALTIAEESTNMPRTIDNIDVYTSTTGVGSYLKAMVTKPEKDSSLISTNDVNTLRSVLNLVEKLLGYKYTSSSARRYVKHIKK